VESTRISSKRISILGKQNIIKIINMEASTLQVYQLLALLTVNTTVFHHFQATKTMIVSVL
jgi:hypothetical protein